MGFSCRRVARRDERKGSWVLPCDEESPFLNYSVQKRRFSSTPWQKTAFLNDSKILYADYLHIGLHFSSSADCSLDEIAYSFSRIVQFRRFLPSSGAKGAKLNDFVQKRRFYAIGRRSLASSKCARWRHRAASVDTVEMRALMRSSMFLPPIDKKRAPA